MGYDLVGVMLFLDLGLYAMVWLRGLTVYKGFFSFFFWSFKD